MRRVTLLGVLAVLAAALVPNGRSVPRLEARAAEKATKLAQVSYIYKGLMVKPPGARAARAKRGQSLFHSYMLQTGTGQKASIAFRDGSLLHLNQRTQVVLRSPSLTRVDRGQVAEEVMPGTNHRLQTSAAVAAAIGTTFVLTVEQTTTHVTVVEGAVQLTSKFGTFSVKTNQQLAVSSTVRLGTARTVDARSAAAWATSMPGPSKPIGTNIALDANGGRVLGASSVRKPHGSSSWAGTSINDGSLQRGWQSSAGAVRQQWVRFEFGAHRSYRVTEVVLSCGATGGQPPANDLRRFQLRVSTTTTSAFKTVLQGTCRKTSDLQIFRLPHTQRARFAELRALDNHGGNAGIAVAEMEVITPDRVTFPAPAANGSVTPTPSGHP